MLTIVKPSANRIDIDFRGDIDADEMRDGLDELSDLSKGIANGVMHCRISEFSPPLLSEIEVEAVHLPKLFALIDRFDRCAVLTDSRWLKKIASFEGAIIPGIEIRGFDLDESATAEAWLSGFDPDQLRAPASAVS